ncbi:MAG TPA: ATP-binding protein [Vicinamibacterales bacterium]|nr:ATP-binding protein [Vicinamibacterales bacterium]
MSALMRVTDWSRTRLGPPEHWPKSLRTMLGVVLGSRFPMLLWWGPELLHLYNDAYRPILRDKHPQSLAAPAAEVWAEVWDVAGPMVKRVQEGGPATWIEDLQLFVKSGDMAEETYFTFSYSPVPGDDGRVGGILNTVQETTAKVQGDREIRMLHDLVARAADARSGHEAFRVVAEVMATNELDLPFTLLYVLKDSGDVFSLVGSTGWGNYEGPAKPPSMALSEPTSRGLWPLAEMMRSGRPLLLDDLAARFGALPVGTWHARPERAIMIPISRSGQSAPFVVLIAGLSPHRTYDSRYQTFFSTLAGQVTTVIAHARAYEAEKKRAEGLAEIDRVKTTFFSNVSHEFRTPLTLMLGPLEDALASRSEVLGSEQRARVLLAHDNALRLLRLVNALLDFSRLESGRLRARYAPVDLASYTRKLAGMFESLCGKAGLRLIIDCPLLSGPIWVDRDMWEKIVPNLISNAFKFTLAGEICVRLHETEKAAVLEVSDTGAGIPETDLPLIFERFHRVPDAIGRSFEGTGIGLSLVRELVELHGGSVAVESAVGRGSIFRVEIPKGVGHLPVEAVADREPEWEDLRHAERLATEASRWAVDATPSPAARSTESTPHRPSGGRVLVVDDNPDLRSYVVGLLSSDFTVITASDGLVALQEARSAPVDLIVSDVMMPNLDGFGLVRELRKDPRTASLPVILLSARAGEEAAVEGLDSGADDYLAKPFSARELIARVRTHIELARMRHEWTSKLEAANEELEAFSYSVSHDLRAPLRHVIGFAKILEECVQRGSADDILHYANRIARSAAGMSRLIDDLLEFSRLGRSPVTKRPVALDEIAVSVRDEIAAHVDATRRIEWRLHPLPIVDADSSLMRQVLVNLFANAVKYSARREHATIEVGTVEGLATEETFFVRDNGAGFDARHADRLFGVFQRLHTDKEFEGTGIGLANVKRIVTRHGGRVWAESALGEGATFYVAIPKSTN